MGQFLGAFNSAAFGEGARGVRVLFASAVLATSATAEAEPWRITPASAEPTGRAEVVAPYAVANRAASAHGYPLASFEPGRPWDLMTGELAGQTVFDPEHLVIRGGVADLLVTQAFDEIDAIRYAFFANLDAAAHMEPVLGLGFRPGAASPMVAATLDVVATRTQPGRTDGRITAEVAAGGYRIADGAGELHEVADLFVEGHLNGVQPGWSQLSAITTASVDAERWAGGSAFQESSATFSAEPEPGRGAAVNEGYVTAEFTAVWWSFTYETATAEVRASLSATASQIHAVEAEMLVDTTGFALWSRIVEPRERIVAASATARAEPWRITPARADMRVLGTADEDGRIAIRAEADGTVQADLLSEALRIKTAEAWPIGIASVIRSRASVNITNPAPLQRQMLVPAEDRALIVPFDNRTMVVS